MSLDYDDLMSRRSDGWTSSYTDNQLLLYNIAVGMGRDPLDLKELPFIFEEPELRGVPTAGMVIGAGGGSLYDNAGINWTGVVHGEQRLTMHRPLPPSAELTGSSRISEVVDKGEEKGALIAVTSETKLASGEALFTTESVIFARRNGGFGGPRDQVKAPHVLPEREPDLVHVTETRLDQAALYRLTGDRTHLHIDPGFAERAGFPRPILHGLCSYGIACRALLASVCEYDPARIRQFDVRFTKPVYPGETIHTDIWLDGETVSYRCRVAERDLVVLNNGLCQLNG
ncbi:MAG: MaoC/PaaZ C-terminal domain-containing protein [Novosphingobium sp.]|nr:MaoC/PaaZ C-terminal domain-containing protein [Novosphingobium sp.]